MQTSIIVMSNCKMFGICIITIERGYLVKEQIIARFLEGE